MKTRTWRPEVALAWTFLVLALGAGGTRARAIDTDEVFRAKTLDARALTAVAFLPVVAISDNPAAEQQVERAWLEFYGEANTRWMPPDEVRSRLAVAAGEPDAGANAVEAQIWRAGEVSAATAVELARILRVDALLSVRLDRWEVADGGRGMVELTAVLTGADGARLWKVSGLSGHGAGRRSNEENFTWTMDWIWDQRFEPRDESRRLGVALYTLLGRWAPVLPDQLFEHTIMPARLASDQKVDR